MGFENLHFDFMLSEAKRVFSVFSKPSGNYICVTKLFFELERPQILATCLFFNFAELCKVWTHSY